MSSLVVVSGRRVDKGWLWVYIFLRSLATVVVVVVGCGGGGGMLVYHVKRDIHARNRTHGVGLERRSARWGCCGGGCGGFNWKKKKKTNVGSDGWLNGLYI